MKNSNDTIGNRTRDLPTCSAVPQPTALPRAPPQRRIIFLNFLSSLLIVRVNNTCISKGTNEMTKVCIPCI